MTRDQFVDGVLFSVSEDPKNCFVVNIRPESKHFHLRAYCLKCNTVGMHLAVGNVAEITDLAIRFEIRALFADTEISLPFSQMNIIQKS